MITLKKRLSSEIYKRLFAVAGENSPTVDEIYDMLEYPPDGGMGDIALPCFKLSRTMRMAPPAIATRLGEGFSCEGISSCEVAGGYLNFRLGPDFLADTVNKVICDGDKYGSDDMGKGKTVVLDYSSLNLAKPFHIGHLVTTVLGHSIKKIHEFVGYKCVGINYLGDWGTQFGKLICAYKKWGSREEIEKDGIDKLVDLYVRINNAIADEKKEGVTALADESRAEFCKMEQGDEENLSLWKWFVEMSLAENEKVYKQLGITFDSYKGESFYTDKMPAQVEKLREKGLLKVDDGASIVDLSEYNMPPCLILKKDGTTLYPTRDIAAAVYRKETYDFDKSIYVTSAGQSLHFAQWFKVVELMGYDWYDKLVHVPYGTVSINGEKLATRTGNVILLRDLFALAIEKVSQIMEEKNPGLENKKETAEAVGVGAIIFYYLSNSRIKDINFVLEDALSFEGNTGPYAQYTYARTCSLLEKANGIPEGAVSSDDYKTPEEKELAKTLSLFSEKVHGALREYEPFIITRYILDICAAFNRFYHECQIVNAEDAQTRRARLMLTAATRQVLSNAFDLICMKKPEKI